MREMLQKKVLLSAVSALFLWGAVFVSYPFAEGLRKVVAVSRFENKTSYGSGGQFVLDDGMADQLTDALIQSGQFVVLERQTLTDVISEQDLAASGRFQKSKSAKTGKLTSAQILVKGTITEFESQSGGSGTGIGLGPVRLGGKSAEAHVGLIIRLIDTTTGEVLDSQRVEGKAKSGGFGFGLNVGSVDFGTEGFHKTPLGKAMQIAIDNAVEFIASKLRDLPFQGNVIKAGAKEVYISAGETNGTSVGDLFTVYSVGEELVNPATGELLGVEEKEIGKVEVVEVKEKYSKAKAAGCDLAQVKTGDVIRGK
jgi:curli biogenesis system outer membrane secretion channel CsgG